MELDQIHKASAGMTPHLLSSRCAVMGRAGTKARLYPGLLAVATAVVATAVVAVVPSSAGAAAPWSTPITISSPHTGVGPLGVTSTNTSTVAWWGWQELAGNGFKFGGAFATRPAGTGAFGPQRSQNSDELVSFDVQGYGDGRLVALSQVLGPRPVRESDPNPLFHVLVTNGSAGGFGPQSTLARANLIGAAQLGIASNGRGIVAYASYDPRIAHRAIVSAALRSSRGRFSRPAVISGRGDAHGVVVAIGRRGDMVVAFVRNRNVMARVRRPGNGWGPIQTLASPTGPTQWTLRAAVSDAGSIEVLWHRRFVSDRMDGAALQARRMGPADSRWGRRTTIEAIGATTPSALVSIPGGFAVGYTVRDAAAGSLSTPRVSLLKPRTTSRLDLAPPSAGVRDVRLAWSDRHGLFATMLQPTQPSNGYGIGLAAFLAPGAAGFGPIETITTAANIAPGFSRDGAPLAIWSAPAAGTDPGIPSELPTRVVQTSTRTG